MRDAVKEKLVAHKADFDRLGVKSLSVFGSVARGEESETSDLDVVVDSTAQPPSTRSWTSRTCSAASRAAASTW